MSDLQLQVQGADAFQEVFRQLRHTQAKSIINSSFRKVSKPLIRSARTNLTGHRHTGNLRRSIGVKPFRRKVGLIIGARTFRNHRGYAGHLMDKGTVQRYRTTRSGRRVSTGRMHGNRFFTNAVNDNRRRIETNLERDFHRSVTEFLNRANRRGR